MKTILTILLLFPFLVFSQYVPKSFFEDVIDLEEKDVLKNLAEKDTLIIINGSYGCFHSETDTFKVFLIGEKYCIETTETVIDADLEFSEIRKQKIVSEKEIQKMMVIESKLSKDGSQVFENDGTDINHIEFFLYRKSTIYFIGVSYDSDISFESF
jgi:5-formaminoimidazole-4-carboxamide-1-beta-D-ribofuranosyl 5'-monophosphate synthetase